MTRIIGLILLVAGANSIAYGQQARVVPGEYIVKYKSTSSVGNVRSRLQAKSALKASFPGMGMYHISMKARLNPDTDLNDIKNDPDVAYVEPNYVYEKSDAKPAAPPSGGAVGAQSTLQDLVSFNWVSTNPGVYSQSSAPTQVAAAWALQTSLTMNPTKTIVAVVDTGLDYTHAVFQPYKTDGTGGTGALWVNAVEAAHGLNGIDDDHNGYVDDINGWNFITNTNNFMDDDDHGTHVAGIILGAGQNIFVRPLAESKILIMPLKFLDSTGSGSTASAINAIYYAVNNGAQVINNSWGGSGYSVALHEALTYAYQNKVLIVSAAGNYATDNDTSAMYPANYDVPSNLSVASTSSTDIISSFSNYGASSVHVASPGEYILSTVPGNQYYYMSGTSMATPFVTGMAALALREYPTLTGYQVKEMVMSSADVEASLHNKVSTGGRINSLSLMQSVQANAYQMVSASQPVYVADYQADRSPAGAAAGCGLVSKAVMKGPGGGTPPNPMAGVIAGLLLLPLIVWFGLRKRTPESRRKFDRFRMNSEIRVKVGDRELVGAMNSISQGGLSFNADEALEKGGIITMSIKSPDGKEIIEVQGQVVWSEANQAYGVQFANAKQGTLAMIQQWTQNLVKS